MNYFLQANSLIFVHFGFGSFNPADATNYFIGEPIINAPTTTAVRRIMQLNQNLILVGSYISFVQNVGTAETSSIFLRVNNTTYILLNNNIQNNASNTFYTNNQTLNSSILSTDTFELKWLTPTWVGGGANPTAVTAGGWLIFKRP